MEETLAAQLLLVEGCVCVLFRGVMCFFNKETELRRMLGVLLLRFFFLIAQRVFLRFMLSFLSFLFFLVAFFGVTLFSLGDGGILENLIVMVAWCYNFKIDRRSGDKGGDRLGSAVFVDR